MDTLAPTAAEPLPAAIDTLPAAASVLDPVARRIEPEELAAEEPVKTSREPETEEILTFVAPVMISSPPFFPEPEAILTEPPVSTPLPA
jgi:hypothetical protein